MSSQSRSELNEKISRLYAELNMLNSVAEALQRHQENLVKMITDAQLTLDTLKTIKEVETGSSILIPLGSLVMINVQIVDNENALLNVGSGVMVKKPISNIEDYLENHILQLQREQLATQKKLEEIANRISILQAELNRLARSYQEQR